jgi:hypothetical protein
MCNISSEYVSQIVSIYDTVIHRYEANKDIIKQADEEVQDLLHEAEFSNPKNAYDGYKLYKALREIRERRRLAKNENAILEEMYVYFKDNTSLKNQLQKIQGNSQKIYNSQQSKVYTPRQRNDLTITNITAKANRPFEDLLKDFHNQEQLKKKHKWQ